MKLSLQMGTLIAVLFFGVGYFAPELIGMANSQPLQEVEIDNRIEKTRAHETIEYNGPYRLLDPESKLVNDEYMYDMMMQAPSQDDFDVTVIMYVYGNIEEACLSDIKEITINTVMESDADQIATVTTEALEKMDTSEYDRCDFEIQGMTVFTQKQEQ